MLKSFQISNFRLFKDLTVKKLSHVNLIVGKNNSGKSTFLEAIELYASNGSPKVLLNLLEFRQETWLTETQLQKDFWSHPARHLFFGHKLPKIAQDGISIGEISSNTKLHFTTAAYQSKNDEEGFLRRIQIDDLMNNQDLENIELFLVGEEGQRKNTRRVLKLDDISVINIQRGSILFNQGFAMDFNYKYQKVPTENISYRELANLWDLTSLTDLTYPRLSRHFCLIDERVSGVAFVQ